MRLKAARSVCDPETPKNMQITRDQSEVPRRQSPERRCMWGLRAAREGDSGQVLPPHLARGEFDVRQMRKLLVAMRHFLRLAESIDEVQDKSRKTAPIAVAGPQLQGSCGHGPP